MKNCLFLLFITLCLHTNPIKSNLPLSIIGGTLAGVSAIGVIEAHKALKALEAEVNSTDPASLSADTSNAIESEFQKRYRLRALAIGCALTGCVLFGVGLADS